MYKRPGALSKSSLISFVFERKQILIKMKINGALILLVVCVHLTEVIYFRLFEILCFKTVLQLVLKSLSIFIYRSHLDYRKIRTINLLPVSDLIME